MIDKAMKDSPALKPGKPEGRSSPQAGKFHTCLQD